MFLKMVFFYNTFITSGAQYDQVIDIDLSTLKVKRKKVTFVFLLVSLLC